MYPCLRLKKAKPSQLKGWLLVKVKTKGLLDFLGFIIIQERRHKMSFLPPDRQPVDPPITLFLWATYTSLKYRIFHTFPRQLVAEPHLTFHQLTELPLPLSFFAYIYWRFLIPDLSYKIISNHEHFIGENAVPKTLSVQRRIFGPSSKSHNLPFH